jgi:uncharacterized protein YukE
MKDYKSMYYFLSGMTGMSLETLETAIESFETNTKILGETAKLIEEASGDMVKSHTKLLEEITRQQAEVSQFLTRNSGETLAGIAKVTGESFQRQSKTFEDVLESLEKSAIENVNVLKEIKDALKSSHQEFKETVTNGEYGKDEPERLTDN